MLERIYVIQQRVTEDSGLVFPDFKPEAYRDEKTADARFFALRAELTPYCGLYYVILPVDLQ